MPINMYMSHRIRCYTLFNITRTGTTNRTKPSDDVAAWLQSRNTQCNFDTILQIISLRSQPELLKDPQKLEINLSEFNKFGLLYLSKEKVYCWSFEFEVQHSSVFDNGIDELGSLYTDCDNVPMIKDSLEVSNLTTFLNISPELKNIHFEII
jgi:hypothetical protein